MVRWQPGSRERLTETALDLYLSRGFEQTTAGDIARSVGLTERSFFRHFTDKREVLFDGQSELARTFIDAIDATPAHTAPLATVAAAVTAADTFFSDERRPWARRRQLVIDRTPALKERELLKLSTLTDQIAEALTRRGVPQPSAALAAETGMGVFAVAFARWIDDGETRSLSVIQGEVSQELRTLTSS